MREYLESIELVGLFLRFSYTGGSDWIWRMAALALICRDVLYYFGKHPEKSYLICIGFSCQCFLILQAYGFGVILHEKFIVKL